MNEHGPTRADKAIVRTIEREEQAAKRHSDGLATEDPRCVEGNCYCFSLL